MEPKEEPRKPRRIPGEGAIYGRSDGRFEAVWDYGVVDGKRKRRKRVIRTKTAAVAALAELRHEAERGLSIEGERMTVGEWITRWLEEEATPTVRPRTLITYRTIVNRHLLPTLGHIPLRKLAPSHVRAYFTRKLDEGLSPSTTQKHHIVLRRALEIAYRYEYVEKNVARMVSPPRAERYAVRPLDRDEIAKFLAAARGHPRETLYVLAATTGLRHAEVLGLTWPCVDLDGGFVRVEKTLVWYGGEFHMDPPKTATSRRAVAIPSPMVALLRSHRAKQAEHRLKAAVWGNEWELVFTDEAGHPIGQRAVRHDFTELLDDAGLRHVRFHDLRHGAATFLLAQGVAMKVVQGVLGHAQMSMTSDLYSHVVPELQREAADRIGEVLFGSA